MGDTIKLFTRNILETGTVTVTGTPDTGYPESRLYDRAVDLYWKDTVTGAVYFVVDQGAANILVANFLAIPKHNFNGEDLHLQYSDDNFVNDNHDAIQAWTQGDNNQIIKDGTYDTVEATVLDDDCADDDTGDWTLEGAGATLAFDTDHYEFGGNSVTTRMTLLGAVTEGEMYRVTCDIKDGTASGETLYLIFYPTGYYYTSELFTTTGSWQTVSFMYESPITEASSKFGLQTNFDVPGTNIEVRNFKVERISAGDITSRYWRVFLSSMTNPKCSEIFLSYGYELDVMAAPAPVKYDQENVQWNRTVGNVERSTKFGDERRVREYSLFLSPANLTNLRAAMDDLNGYSKPFYIKDDEGDYWPCRLLKVPKELPDHPTYTHTQLSVIEML